MAQATIWNNQTRSVYLSATFTLWMTDREKEIELGTSWDFGPLKKGECIMSDSYVSELNLTTKILQFNLPMHETFNAITDDYNVLAEEHNWKRYDTSDRVKTLYDATCNVVGTYHLPKGKFPSH
jgi:hypothetical protein